LKKIVLITGAAGKVGSLLRSGLARDYQLRLLDIVPIPEAPDAIVGDINDGALLDHAMSRIDAVVHLAADPRVKAEFTSVLHSNISGTYQVFEAARRNGVKRIVFAGTSHAVEYHSPLLSLRHGKEEELLPVTFPLSFKVPGKPDSLYGVSKLFGEALARYYADAFQVTSVCLRLGSVTPDPAFLSQPRAWALWISTRDLCEAFRCSIEAEGIGSAVVYACSANTRRWWDLVPARELIGFVPQDDSETMITAWYREGLVPPAPNYPIPWGERLAALPVSDSKGMLVWIGQSGFFFKPADSMCLAIDPFLTVWPDRLQTPLLSADELPADVILITHTHRDHLDAHALPVIAKKRPKVRFITPATGRDKLVDLGVNPECITTLSPDQSFGIGPVQITAIPARHEATAPDAQGYVIRTPYTTLYHTGDTEYDPCLWNARGHKPDLLLVPINGRKGNMTAEQAAQLAADIAPRAVIPMHYGCLQPQADLLDRFLAELAVAAPAVVAAVMEPGAILQLPLKTQS